MSRTITQRAALCVAVLLQLLAVASADAQNTRPNILPRSKGTFVAELRWLPELDVKNRLDGDYVWLKLVYQF